MTDRAGQVRPGQVYLGQVFVAAVPVTRAVAILARWRMVILTAGFLEDSCRLGRPDFLTHKS